MTVEVYSTEKGSRVEIMGAHRGVAIITFDWFEEGACVESGRRVDVDVRDPHDAWLHWECVCHGQRQAELRRVD